MDGEIRNVNGMLLMTKLAEQEGFATLFMPTEDTPEASLIEGLMVYANESLLQLE